MHKFRFWDGEKMVSWDEMMITPEYFMSCFLVDALTNPDEIHILMKFTGETDSQGTEIYEGDILMQTRDDQFYGRGVNTIMTVVGNPTWEILTDQDGGGPDGSFPIIEQVIVGNVFENGDMIDV